jgi:hypothetical protein
VPPSSGLPKRFGVTHAQAFRLGAVAFLSLSASQAAETTQPREHFEHATLPFDWVITGAVKKVRTLITRSNNISGKVPAIFFVGWLSCDTMPAK